jgi:mannose-6-phosphate isomerase-like protein (cupin superfamily)
MPAKYDKYVQKKPLGKLDTQPALKDILRFELNGPKWGKDLIIGYSAAHVPMFMLKEPHTHAYDEFVVFLGSDAMHLDQFDAEIEMWLGPEQEKHIITSATTVYAPAGFPHCPLNFKVVKKPVILITITLGKEYVQDKVPAK